MIDIQHVISFNSQTETETLGFLGLHALSCYLQYVAVTVALLELERPKV